ncbi:MAG: DUF202 domain-containing protein [Waterburya sp.]
MAESNQFSKPPNFQIELAKERNRIAVERTLLSWIRTSVSLIGNSSLAKYYHEYICGGVLKITMLREIRL